MYLLKGKLEQRRALVKVGIRPFQPYQPVDGYSAAHDLNFREYTALVDTGALRTCISERVIADLGLAKRSRVEINNVKKAEMHWTYLFYVGIWPESIDAESPTNTVIGLGSEIEGIDLGYNKYFDVLLGMDVIGKGYLHIEMDGTFELGFPRQATY